MVRSIAKNIFVDVVSCLASPRYFDRFAIPDIDSIPVSFDTPILKRLKWNAKLSYDTLPRNQTHALRRHADLCLRTAGVRAGLGTLQYVIDREYGINGHTLLPGDVTYALYWEDRPYTLYVWNSGNRDGRLFYFNIADSISLGREEFVWRDLAIDVLIDAADGIDILDKHELPPDVDRELRVYIDQAVDLVVKQHREIIREANERIERHGR